jgi:ABC-type branched-subunit amino acid transport system substrate-binding protein/tetratricopeptide (TPR) repeat protein
MGMKNRMNRFLAIFSLLLMGVASSLWAQPGNDERAVELVSLARKYYATKNFLDAATTFDLATQRPSNDLSSYCMYMTGIAYYKADDKVKAENALSRFLYKFPDSKYLDDARYHRGLILMESPHVNDREKGLDEMFKLLGRSKDKQIKDDAQQTLLHFICEVYEPSMLDVYAKFVDGTYRPWFMEGICLYYDRRGEGSKMLERLKEYESQGETMTPTLTGLRKKYSSGKVNVAGRLNIAVMLSFNLQLADTARVVPSKSEKALEMLEGMMMALDSLGKQVGKQINVRAFDTRGDTTLIPRLLDSLSRFSPDVIIGDVKTGLASAISDWAEKNKVVHLIPRNPLTDLIVNKKYTFLVHPSLRAHGAQMARYMVQTEGKHKFVIFNDRTYYADKFSAGFKNAIANEPGVTVVEKIIPSKYGELQPKLSSELRSIKDAGYDMIYAPFANEESAGLLMAKLNYDNIKIEVAGGPDWETFSVIDQDLKSSYKLKYSSFYYENNDSTAFDGLYRRCLQTYSYRPSMNTVQGFDTMMWLLTVSKGMNGNNSLADLIRKAPNYHGIHQDFYFGDQQDNQKINILEYNDGRLNKIN